MKMLTRLLAGLLAASAPLFSAPLPSGFGESANEVLGPGVTYQKFVRAGASPLVVHVTEADLEDPRVQVRGVTANDIYASGRKSVQALARQQAEKGGGAVVAAVNGDYFDFTTSGTTSASIHNGQVVRGGVSSAVRSTFVLTESRDVSFGVNYVSGGTVLSLATQQSHPLHGANTSRAANQFILFTPYHGSTVASSAAADVRDIVLKPLGPARINAPVDYEVVSILSGGGSIGVPAGHYLLSASSGLRAWVEANLLVGQQVRITAQLSAESRPVSQMIGGGPRLLTDGAYAYPPDFSGAENVGHALQLAARTAVGVTAARKLQLVVVDRGAQSDGVTLAHLADLMLALGSTDALNLDGGGSSTLVAGTDYALRNAPADGSQRLVANGIVVETDIPLSQRVASLDLEPAVVEMPIHGSVAMRTFATDHAGVRFPLSPSLVSWTAAGIGAVNTSGAVSSAFPGYGVLRASAAGLDTGAVISVGKQPELWGWRVSAADGNLEAWDWFSPTNSYARGIALGLVGGTPLLAIMNRATNSLIGAIDEGAPLDSINRTGVSGGTYATNDVEFSDDGILFAANLTTNASTTAFRVYQWNNGAASAPTRIIDYTGSTHRLGDKITVVGSVAARTATLYAAASSGTAATSAVLRWVINPDGTWPSSPTLITLGGVTNAGGQADVAPIAPGTSSNFWINGNGFPATLHSPTGALLATLDPAILPVTSNAIAYLQFGGRAYLAAYLQGPGQENARVIDLTNGPAQASVVLTTAPLGDNANTAGNSGDVDWLVRPDQSEAVLAILATNNGVELIGLPAPSEPKPLLVIAPSTTAPLAAPYAEAEFWVAATDTFATNQLIQINASGVPGVSVPAVILPAGRRFVRLPVSGAPEPSDAPVTLTGTLAENSAWIVAAPGTATLALLPPSAPGDSFASWLDDEFSPSERADPAVSGANADPERIGWPNLLRYALGLPRHAPHEIRGTLAPRAEPTAGFLKLSYVRPVGGRADVDYLVEGSSNLASWSPLDAAVVVTPLGDDYELVEVTDTVALSSSPRRFLRLRVELRD